MTNLFARYPFKTTPYAHQLQALEQGWDRESYAYLMEMGTGKSKVILDNAAMLFDYGRIEGLFIVCPKSIMMNWRDNEIPAHLPEHINHRVAVWNSTPRIKERRAINRVFEPTTDFVIFIMNVEAISTKKAYKFAEQFLLGRPCLMAVDESTTIKNPKAQRTKASTSLSIHAPYRRIATGSPVTRSPLDLFAQCKFMDWTLLGYDNQFSFRNRYAITAPVMFGDRKVNTVVGYKNLPELTENLAKFSFRVTKDECLDLPEKVFTKRQVEMTAEQKRLYEDMRQMAFATLEGEQITTTAVITQLLRLHQIVCGHIVTDSGNLKAVDQNRIRVLTDVLAETDGKVIIWANYRHDIQLIKEALVKLYGEETCVTFYGDTSQDNRKESVDSFQDSDSPVRFFIANTQTGGYGLTLTAANTVVYYSNNYDLEKRLQSEDRCHRIGQTHPVAYVDLIAEDTVDEKIIRALREKINIANAITGDEWREWI